MEHTHLREANSTSASQKILHISFNTKVHYRVHKSLPNIPILNQNSLSTPSHATSWKSILILPSHVN